MPIPASCAGQTYICMVQLDLKTFSKPFLLHKMTGPYYRLMVTFEHYAHIQMEEDRVR